MLEAHPGLGGLTPAGWRADVLLVRNSLNTSFSGSRGASLFVACGHKFRWVLAGHSRLARRSIRYSGRQPSAEVMRKRRSGAGRRIHHDWRRDTAVPPAQLASTIYR